MFKKFVKELIKAQTEVEMTKILYGTDGVDMAYQKGKISWQDHELLFELAKRIPVEGEVEELW